MEPTEIRRQGSVVPLWRLQEIPRNARAARLRMGSMETKALLNVDTVFYGMP
jgi:hypothetical protein